MAKLFLFNPENDSALASQGGNYTPSKGARRLHDDGALLPLWWAGEDDFVLGKSGHETDALKHRFNLKAEIIESARGIDISQCCPWGWSKNARHQFLKAGIDSSVLPDDDCIENMRQLSHRRTTILLMERLHSTGILKNLPAVPLEITSINQLPKGQVYLKLPWSSSGRGVMACDTTKLSPSTQGRIEGMIHRQGSVIVEPALDKVADFAMLFYVDSADCKFKGYSLFNTDHSGAYLGNIVAPPSYIYNLASRFLDKDVAEKLIEFYQRNLHEIYGPHYEGWLGIDMMIYRDNTGHYAISPCTEVNMRMTMGVVALYLSQNKSLVSNFPALYSVSSVYNINDGGIDLLPRGEQFAFTLNSL